MKTKINITNTYITNYKPKSNLTSLKFLYTSINNKNTIHCRNFFLFLLLLKHTNSLNTKSKFFIKPYSRNVFTFLRSPYRHKLARHQVCIQRYEIHSSIVFYLNKKIIFEKLEDFFLFFSTFKSISGWFETNIIYQHKIKANFVFFYKNNFIFKNYK